MDGRGLRRHDHAARRCQGAAPDRREAAPGAQHGVATRVPHGAGGTRRPRCDRGWRRAPGRPCGVQGRPVPGRRCRRPRHRYSRPPPSERSPARDAVRRGVHLPRSCVDGRADPVVRVRDQGAGTRRTARRRRRRSGARRSGGGRGGCGAVGGLHHAPRARPVRHEAGGVGERARGRRAGAPRFRRRRGVRTRPPCLRRAAGGAGGRVRRGIARRGCRGRCGRSLAHVADRVTGCDGAEHAPRLALARRCSGDLGRRGGRRGVARMARTARGALDGRSPVGRAHVPALVRRPARWCEAADGRHPERVAARVPRRGDDRGDRGAVRRDRPRRRRRLR